MLRIKYKNGICDGCNEDKVIVHKTLNLCNWCDAKRKTKLYTKRRKERAAKGGLVDKAEMGKFFKKYWNTHTDRRCFETGTPIYHYRSWHLHHLLEKSERPDVAYQEGNIVYLTQEQHSLWHSLTQKKREEQMPKTYARFLQIKEKYKK